MNSAVKVLMLGESLDKKGGIVSVQKLILKLGETNADIEFKHLPTLIDGTSIQKALCFLQTLFELFFLLIFQNFDLVHIHVSERGSAFRQAITTLVSSIFRTPTIVHTHGPEFHLFYSQLPHLLQNFLSWSFRRASHFIVLSEYWKQFYCENLGLELEKVSVLPNAVVIPTACPQRLKEKEEVYFVFLGRIGYRKGAFDLVQAFSTLSIEHKNRAKLLIAGDGEAKKLRNLISELSLDNKIAVMDWITPEQRNSVLEEADVFVLPSYNEALPMALLEAMSWGLPVIATPVGGIPEIVFSEKNGLLVKPGNIDELADALVSLIICGHKRINFGKAARESILRFDASSYHETLLKIYCSIA